MNNCGKRILLEQLRAYVERDPTGTVVLVGHVSNDETGGEPGAAARDECGGCHHCRHGSLPVGSSIASADQRTGRGPDGVGFESGFCQASVGKGPAGTVDARRVEVWFVPTGGALPSSVTNNQSASALSVSGLGCPK